MQVSKISVAVVNSGGGGDADGRGGSGGDGDGADGRVVWSIFLNNMARGGEV